MPEQLRNLLNRIKEWWNRFTNRQKGIIIGMVVFAAVLFGIIVYFVSRPQYTKLITCETTAQTSKVTEILSSAGITDYQLSTDALEISVRVEQLSEAEVALGAGGYTPDTYTLEDALSSSLSTTASDKSRKYQLYLETQLQESLKTISGINSAKVHLNIPDQDGTLIAKQEESTAYIQLDTDPGFTASNAANVAKAVASLLHNSSTAGITILNSDGELLFSGNDDNTTAGAANSLQELQNTAENYLTNQVKIVLYGTKSFNSVEVTSHLDMDYATYEKTVKEYYANSGRDEGMLSHKETYDAESTNGVGGVPGTDSNGEGTTYVTNDYSDSSSSSQETITDYLPNESAIYSQIAAGAINYGSSSISISAIAFKELHEEDAKTLGLLDDTTWDAYKLANNTRTKIEVDEEFYNLVATATGIPASSVTIIAYEEPVFYDKESVQISWTTVLSIVLMILILGLLAFVVLRSMSDRKHLEEEEPEELSVAAMLQSNPEPEIEDIDVEAKSETRKMIEKFVDENPEAAAILLRNWLSDEWR